jgi:CubicO group peptidase (beta-lactamase class C family)
MLPSSQFTCAIILGLTVSQAAAQSPATAAANRSVPDGSSTGSELSIGRRVDEFVLSEMARQRVPGVAIAIVNKGETTAKGYGYANLEHKVPVTDETIFQSGSIGKMFTATAVMLLVEDGKFSLSDPITKFFPDAPVAWREITVRHLLTHTSGLPDYTKIPFDYRKDYTESELARFAYELPLDFLPGARYNYSSTGYVLLGVIIHKVSGKFYGDVLAERVFKPVGMQTARIISEADIVPNRAAGYQLVKGELKNQDWVAPILNTTADGSIYWSLRDLLAWATAFRRRAILKPESWEQILTPVRLNSGKSYPYGMGWELDERDRKPLHHHGGSWQGFKSEFARFAGDDLDIIVFANLAQADRMRFVNGIAAILNPLLAVKPPVPIEDREPQVAQRLARWLDTIREGKLTPTDFAYLSPGFFPDTANSYRQELQTLGSPTGTQLFERMELGDDRLYLYKLTFPTGSRYLRVGLAPDDRFSSFSIKSEP